MNPKQNLVPMPDYDIVVAWKKIFNKEFKDLTPLDKLSRPVKPSLARECAELYQSIYKNLTQYVKFDSLEFALWWINLPKVCQFDSFRLTLGIYTHNILNEYKPTRLGLDLGKISIFIVPYNGEVPAVYDANQPNPGDEVMPFNMGEIYP